MASSNRHSWPSMFKTKSCVNSTTHHPNWIHHDNNNINSNASQKSGPLSSSGGGEERAPEPKPRWNPRPEQIRILEAIFNSGTVNPSRDEIRKIRSQLQEYGQVGDANVFYWFQNRKSRSKHKQQRHLINNNQKPPKSLPQPPPPPSPPIFSISSSLPPPAVEKCTPPPFLQNHENDFLKAPFFPVLSQGFNSSFPGHHESHQFLDESSFLLSDFLLGFTTASTKNINAELEEKMMMMKMQQQLLSYSSGANNSTTVSSSTISGANQMNVSSTSFSALSAIHHTHQGACGGVGETCIMSTPPPPPPPIKSSIIFINDVAYEVAMGPFNVRETFGDDAILIHSNGQPVITNEWGVALEPLQHGAFYYLIRTLPPPSPLDTTTTTLTNLV